MRANNSGVCIPNRLGIGTSVFNSNPAHALHVHGSATGITFTQSYNFHFQGVGGYRNYSYGPRNIMARVDGEAMFYQNVWVQNGYYASSDRRIKTNIRDVPDDEALELVRSIPVRYYEYKDKLQRGEECVVGFIAQEVAEIAPEMVQYKTCEIPDVMRKIDCSWEETTEGNFEMGSNDISDIEGTAYRFLVDCASSGEGDYDDMVVTCNERGKYAFDRKWETVICYGRQVDDFCALEKNKLFALNFSATQQIDRIQRKHAEELTIMKAKIEQLELKMKD
jgi:hypothetical protein